MAGAPAAGLDSSDADDPDERRRLLEDELDAMTATDAELEDAVAELTSAVARQRAAAGAARQAATVTEEARAEAQGRAQGARDRVAGAEEEVVERAVETFMRPQTARLEELIEATSIAEATRRSALLDVVAGRDADVLDQLAVARADLDAEETAAARRADEAARRHREAAARLAELEAARTEQAEAEAALEERIRGSRAEIEALAAEQAQIAALIGEGTTGPVALSASGLAWPVRGRVTSEFGPRWGRMHQGMDIAAPTGTPIVASKAGRVTFAGQQGGYGTIVILDHGGGFSTVYPHQSRLAATRGDSVDQGEVIGYVGCSGSCTGPHVHFETRVGGTAQNPRRFLP